MWYEIKEDRALFAIKALPNSSKNQIVGIYDDMLKIKIKAPAVEGAANKEIIKFLSKEFKIPKNEVVFVTGERSKRKRVSIPISDKVDEFIKEMKE